MSFSQSVDGAAQRVAEDSAAPDGAGKFSVNEDWLAVVVGLVLLALALTGLIPARLIP